MPCLPSNSSTNPYHTPLFKGMMQRIESKYRAPFYGFANGDILFPPSLVSLLEEVRLRIARPPRRNTQFQVCPSRHSSPIRSRFQSWSSRAR